MAKFLGGAGVEWITRLGNKCIGIFKDNGLHKVSILRKPIATA
jgi:hypothetical protein